MILLLWLERSLVTVLSHMFRRRTIRHSREETRIMYWSARHKSIEAKWTVVFSFVMLRRVVVDGNLLWQIEALSRFTNGRVLNCPSEDHMNCRWELNLRSNTLSSPFVFAFRKISPFLQSSTYNNDIWILNGRCLFNHLLPPPHPKHPPPCWSLRHRPWRPRPVVHHLQALSFHFGHSGPSSPLDPWPRTERSVA